MDGNQEFENTKKMSHLMNFSAKIERKLDFFE